MSLILYGTTGTTDHKKKYKDFPLQVNTAGGIQSEKFVTDEFHL